MDGDEISSKVETLSGHVALADHKQAAALDLKRGESAAFVSSKANAQKGQFTAVYALSEKQIADLDQATQIARMDKGQGLGRAPSSESKDKEICAEPIGKFKQCSWTCEKNPQGEKRCRTDLSEVQCVRRICNANGSWSEPTRLPASSYGNCDGVRINVGPCDY
ncbi:MAG: hypothetical protein ABL860_05850, partial [Candidatus Nitrotoga sp.]